MSKNCITYHIDKEHRIIFLSDEWQSFANENKASFLTADTVINKSIFEFIADGECKHLYQMIVDRSRKEQVEMRLSFRCDSPDKRRFMSMEVFPLKDEAIGIKSCILREEIRDPVLLMSTGIDRTDEILLICSWCKKVKTDENKWVEVEEAIEQMGLFGASSFPKLSHGMCPACSGEVRKELANRRK